MFKEKAEDTKDFLMLNRFASGHIWNEGTLMRFGDTSSYRVIRIKVMIDDWRSFNSGEGLM